MITKISILNVLLLVETNTAGYIVLSLVDRRLGGEVFARTKFTFLFLSFILQQKNSIRIEISQYNAIKKNKQTKFDENI